MSILGKEWTLRHERQPRESLWQALLAARHIENPGAFFASASVEDLHDPFLFPDMQKAVQRIQKAVKARERILVYGDYDVDGTSGAALLVHTLRLLGAACSYRTPHRLKDGYGLHEKHVRQAIEADVRVLITVDCGISCAAEVAFAQNGGPLSPPAGGSAEYPPGTAGSDKSPLSSAADHAVSSQSASSLSSATENPISAAPPTSGPSSARASGSRRPIDIILTDHHSIPAELPPAFAILHPELAPDYPFKKLSGSGVAFKLACALLIASDHEDFIPALTDLASLGTVADCVPLIGENRAIVKLGLKQMEATRWPGLQAILESSGHWGKQDFSAGTIGFQIGPRINAAGRMQDPLWALQTLLADNPQKAREKAQKLDQLNAKRRHLTEEILREAEITLDHSKPLLIAAAPNWPSSVVGLIAGRLQEKYTKPSFILEDRGNSLVGSARSLPGFHAVRALDQAAHLLENYGGHEQAAGFHLKKENYPEFQNILQKFAIEYFKKTPLKSELKLDAQLSPADLTLENTQKIQSFHPFGIGNATPKFLLKNARIKNLKTVGREHKHLKFSVELPTITLGAIAFNFAEHATALQNATELAVHLEINEWQNKQSLQLRLIDAKL